MSICKGCGAQIDWVKVESGKMMPVEGDYITYDEADIGDVLIADDGLVLRINDHNEIPGFAGRISHFSVCPEGNEFRKTNKIKAKNEEKIDEMEREQQEREYFKRRQR